MKTLIQSLTIKLSSFTILLYLISNLSFSQNIVSSSTSKFNDVKEKSTIKFEDEKWPFFSFSFNAASIIVMGPMAQIDFRIAEKTYVGAYYVNHHMGILASSIIFDSDITDFSPKSMGGGINLKHYFKVNEKLNAWYYGIYLGYSYNEATYHSGLANEKVEQAKDILLFGSGGYRWNFGKHFYGLAGLMFGVADAYDDKLISTYTINPQTGTYLYGDYSGDIYPYVLPELTIGINF
jgi:hypothetical protein